MQGEPTCQGPFRVRPLAANRPPRCDATRTGRVLACAVALALRHLRVLSVFRAVSKLASTACRRRVAPSGHGALAVREPAICPPRRAGSAMGIFGGRVSPPHHDGPGVLGRVKGTRLRRRCAPLTQPARPREEPLRRNPIVRGAPGEPRRDAHRRNGSEMALITANSWLAHTVPRAPSERASAATSAKLAIAHHRRPSFG